MIVPPAALVCTSIFTIIVSLLTLVASIAAWEGSQDSRLEAVENDVRDLKQEIRNDLRHIRDRVDLLTIGKKP